jgi:copper chaperone CopZ
VGKAALEGLPGVKKVTSGFYKFKEINTVVYDPDKISADVMIRALEKADTYIGIAK